MEEEKTNTSKFPKGFFTSIKPCKSIHSNKPEEKDIPFKWNENVLKGNSKVKIVSLKNN